MLTNNQKRAVIDLAKAAGEKIMAIYAQDFDVDYKDDSSPLTKLTLLRIIVLLMDYAS